MAGAGRTMTHSSSKSQMTFGDKNDFAGVKPLDEQVVASPYEDLKAPSQYQGKTAAPGRHQEDSQKSPPQKHPRNVTITVAADGKNAASSYELIGEQLVSPEHQSSPGASTTLERNPFTSSHQGSIS